MSDLSKVIIVSVVQSSQQYSTPVTHWPESLECKYKVQMWTCMMAHVSRPCTGRKALVHTDINIQTGMRSNACAQRQIFTFIDTLQPSRHGWKISNCRTYIKQHYTKEPPLKTLGASIINKSTFSSSTVCWMHWRQCHWSHCSKNQNGFRCRLVIGNALWCTIHLNIQILPNSSISSTSIFACSDPPAFPSVRGRLFISECVCVCFTAAVFMFSVWERVG